jgi:Flp pilus assembly pilin Flp
MRKRIVRISTWYFTLGENGQATTEYALILLVAAIIALLVIAWATAGGGAGKIGSLFDTVFNDIFDRASNSTP